MVQDPAPPDCEINVEINNTVVHNFDKMSILNSPANNNFDHINFNEMSPLNMPVNVQDVPASPLSEFSEASNTNKSNNDTFEISNSQDIQNISTISHALPMLDGGVEDSTSKLNNLKLNNPKKVTVGHLNINSIPNKFDGIMDMTKKKLDIFLISETKIDNSFPEAQFCCEGYSHPHRRDRCLGAGGLLMYVNQDIPSRILKSHDTPEDIEIMCVEINLRKQKWVVIGIYRPPNLNAIYFSNHLSRVLDLYSKKYDNLIIMGDFNSQETDENMKNLLISFNLVNLVRENTCFKGPPKCYDMILTNRKYHFQNTLALTTGFSDFHKMTVTVLKTEFVKSDPIQINYRDYKNYDSANFEEELKFTLLANEGSFSDFRKFQSILCEVLDKHAPIKKKIMRANDSPFMTKALRKMIMNRSRCKNAYCKNKTLENWEKYRKLRNECLKLTRKTKKEYFHNLDISAINDNRTFWKTVKPFFTTKGIKGSNKIILLEKEEIISDNSKVTEIMNDYFVNIASEVGVSIPTNESNLNRDLTFIDQIEQIMNDYSEHPSILKINERIKHPTPFFFDCITASLIEDEIMDLNSKKPSGYDCIPPKILKHSVNVIKGPLSEIFNTSVIENFFPPDLKYANVSPLFKKENNTNKENYRPISILPTISKNFERIMFHQMTTYVSSILSPYLCGFRKGYSTQHALLRLKDKMNKSLDKNENMGLFMMDLSKAFDCIPHELLIAKLNAYGFDKTSLKLIYSYLKNRHQRVKINSTYSSWKEIINGVPQGSVLGPLLFNLFINDIFYFVKDSDICNYADDNTLSVSDVDIDNIINRLEVDICLLNKWFNDNGLALNKNKCQFMIVESNRAARNEVSNISFGNTTIAECNKSQLLGITFDKNISMTDHINKMCKRASNKLHALARISSYLSDHQRKILMHSFVLSQFSYCPIIWMFCNRKSNNLINKIHERALRIAYNDYISDFENLLSKDESITIHQRNIQVLTCEIQKTINNKNPIFMKEIFSLKENKYPSRNQRINSIVPSTVTYGLESFGFKGSQIWNSIPRDIQTSNQEKIEEYIQTNGKNLCNCNLCKLYIPNLGYIENVKYALN